VALVLGVDSSTQSTKVEVRNADSGVLIGSGSAPHPPVAPPCSEQDPKTWYEALLGATARAGARRPAAIAVAGQQHGLVLLGERDLPLRPAKLWNDTESAADAKWLREQLDGGAAGWAAAVGSVPVAAFTITKLSWVHRCEPDVFARIRRVLLPHDYLTFRLTNEFVTDRGDASGTGYWSPASGEWRPDVLRIVDGELDWAAALPRVLGPLESIPARDGDAIVAAGTGDNMAAALGLALEPGRVAISIGTSGTVYTVSDTPTADPSGAVAGFASACGRYLPLVCTQNATRVTDTMARLLGVDHDGLAALALSDAATAHESVTLVPYFDGERTPERPDATGLIAGLRNDLEREHLARAAFEGVVCGLLDGLDALGAAGVDTGDELGNQITLVGGGSRSPAYRQVLADLAQRPVVVPAGDEHVALGACVQAAAALHQVSPREIARQWELGSGTVVDPTGSADRAAALRARYAAARG
jgi:xylulokinase